MDRRRHPDQSGRSIVITGASHGLGLATARALARKGAHVVMAVRNPIAQSAEVQRVKAARDSDTARRLWELSEEPDIVGLYGSAAYETEAF